MSGFIKFAIIAGIILYVGTQALKTFKAKGDLTVKVTQYLDQVDARSMNSVKSSLVADAKTMGITLLPDNIQIGYDDTDVQSAAQQIVGGRLGTKFTNKRVTIICRYTAKVVGVPVSLEVNEFKIVQVAAPTYTPHKAAQEVLDSD